LTREELKERGIDQVIAKPFDMPTLLSLVEDAVTLNSGK
jgi:hypothetical protein